MQFIQCKQVKQLKVIRVGFSNLSLKYLQLRQMSSIIDGDVFVTSQHQIAGSTVNQLLVLSQNICKSMKWKDDPFLVLERREKFQAALRMETMGCSYLIQFNATRTGSTTRVIVLLLNRSAYYRLSSPHIQAILKKELLKRKKECPPEAIFCVHQRRVILILNNFLVPSTYYHQKTTQMYIRFIAKNVAHFNQVLRKSLKIENLSKHKDKQLIELQNQLAMSCSLSTIQSNVDISCQKSQYKFAMREIQKQSNQIQSIQNNIVMNGEIQKNIKLLYFLIPESVTSYHLQQNLIPFYLKNIKSFSKLLQIPTAIEKRPEDYLHSIVSISNECKQTDMPIGQGGTSLIFLFKVTITYINQRPKQMSIIKKILRPYSKVAKMEHEKAIVSQLTNSVSHFIPKYYSVADNNEMKNCLLMELIIGQQLDIYLNKNFFLSFWSKLYLTLNIIQGIRHLIKQGIVHLDLKPSNILVCSQLITKIIDYGQAFHREVCHPSYVPGYTFPYVAPQVISLILSPRQSFEYSEKQDAFAFGLILSEIFFSNKIFSLSSQAFKDVYSNSKQMERFMLCPQNLETFGDEIFMTTILLIIQKCIGQPLRRPRFQWINIIMRLIHDSYFNSF